MEIPAMRSFSSAASLLIVRDFSSTALGIVSPKGQQSAGERQGGATRPHPRLSDDDHHRRCCRRFCGHLCRCLWQMSFVNVSSVAPMNQMLFPNLIKHPLELLGRNAGVLRDFIIRTSSATGARFYGVSAEEQDEKRQTYYARCPHRRVSLS